MNPQSARSIARRAVSGRPGTCVMRAQRGRHPGQRLGCDRLGPRSRRGVSAAGGSDAHHAARPVQWTRPLTGATSRPSALATRRAANTGCVRIMASLGFQEAPIHCQRATARSTTTSISALTMCLSLTSAMRACSTVVLTMRHLPSGRASFHRIVAGCTASLGHNH